MKNSTTKAWLAASLLSSGLVAGACAGPTPESPGEPTARRTLALEDCHLSTAGAATRIPALCGTLVVPEDRGTPDGRTIPLRIAVLEAVSRNPAGDPLFLLAGGPGQAATEAFLPALGSLSGIRETRDLVLVDQRGTGSSNPLDCDDTEELDEFSFPTPEESRELLETCLQGLDADPTLYTTSIAMEDLDAVREALGYERVNLYGVSYGTRAALTYLDLYPDRVRSMILDGVVPQDLAVGTTWAQDAQRSLDLLLARCAETTACAAAFPSPGEDFTQLLEALEERPRQVSFAHPVSGEPLDLEIDRELVVSVVQRLSYSPETAALLPMLIANAVSRNDLATLAAQGVLAGEIGGGMSTGMTLSVLCAEDVAFFDSVMPEGETPAELAAGTYYGDLQLRLLRQNCAVWPHGEAPDGFKDPVTSDVPTLLLSGEADPVTPPPYGEQVAAGLANSLHLVAPGLGHNVLPRGCLPKVAEAFVEAGSVEGLEAECVAEIQPPPFFLTPAGPSP